MLGMAPRLDFSGFFPKILDVAVIFVKKWSTEPKFALDSTLNLLKTCLNIVFEHFEQLCRVTSRATRPLGSIFTCLTPKLLKFKLKDPRHQFNHFYMHF